MKKLVPSLIVSGVFLAVGLKTWPSKPTPKPTLERAWIEGGAVLYIDRTDPRLEIHYMDNGPDGELNEAVYLYRNENGRPDGNGLIISLITTQSHAGEMMSEVLTKGHLFAPGSNVPHIYIWKESTEGHRLRAQYRDIRSRYHKLHPSDYPENRVQKPEPARPEVITYLGRWVDEYLRHRKDERAWEKIPFSPKVETSTYHAHLSQRYLGEAYRQLNEREKSSLFSWDHELGDDALKIGMKVAEVLKNEKGLWSYWPENPREEFEEYLSEPEEIDFMSSFSIAPQFGKIELAYKQDLKRRGLLK